MSAHGGHRLVLDLFVCFGEEGLDVQIIAFESIERSKSTCGEQNTSLIISLLEVWVLSDVKLQRLVFTEHQFLLFVAVAVSLLSTFVQSAELNHLGLLFLILVIVGFVG